MGASEITSIILGTLTLLGGCGWFVEGRKHRETARLLNADHNLKEMELGQLYVEQFEKNIAEPLRRDVRGLHEKAAASDRLRMNFDLRTTPADTSQRMLNALEVGTCVPIHRPLKTSETVVCLEGCLDWVFYEEMAGVDTGGPVHDGETAADETQFAETARFRVCPRDGVFGIQVPRGAWHSIEVHEASTIFEAKDGAYGK